MRQEWLVNDMISSEVFEIDGQTFRHTKSDTYMIHKAGTNETYNDAIDLLESNFQYQETNISITPQDVQE